MTPGPLTEHRDRLLAALDDDGTGNWLNALNRLGWQVVPHCRGMEFEIKYAPVTAPADGMLGDYVRTLRGAPFPDDLVSPDWVRLSESHAEYWLIDGVEWSVQRANGRERLKRKQHQVFRRSDGGAPLVQATEDFRENHDSVAEMARRGGRSLGALRKTRAKAYIVRLDLGVVLNLTESRCYVGDAVQVQVELEYSAHVYPDPVPPSERLRPAGLRALLWDVDEALEPALRAAGLEPTIEKKQDFVLAMQRKPRDPDGRS